MLIVGSSLAGSYNSCGTTLRDRDIMTSFRTLFCRSSSIPLPNYVVLSYFVFSLLSLWFENCRPCVGANHQVYDCKVPAVEDDDLVHAKYVLYLESNTFINIGICRLHYLLMGQDTSQW